MTANAAHATAAGTARYAARFPAAAEGHFRPFDDLTVSSLGMGTYLGPATDEADRGFTAAAIRFVEGGGNVLDTAVNYRFQRSERALGRAIRELAAKGFARDEFVVCTKGGYVPYDGEPPRSPEEATASVERTFVKPGIAKRSEIVQNSQCLAPRYLEHQVATSLRNLGVEALDVYYLHNPEMLLPVLGPDDFYAMLRRAFEQLETEVERGRVRRYGLATWEAFRITADHFHWLDLPAIEGIAREVAGVNHRFRAIQLPVNLGMPEALTVASQPPPDARRTILAAAADLGIAVVASSSLLQGRLPGRLPDVVAEAFPEAADDVERALQFARSAPGVATALVGMGRIEHVERNLRLVGVPPARRETLDALLDPR